MKILKMVFNGCLLLVSFLIPKSRKIVMVGGWYGKRYADNSKGIFEYLNQNKDHYGLRKVIWHTKNKEIYESLFDQGYDVVYGFSPKAIYYHLRSKTHIIDQNPHDIIGFLSVRCVRINLWHGFPLKKIGNLIAGDEHKFTLYDKLASGGFWVDQYLLATSDLCKDLLTRAMGIKNDKCIIGSYPRTINLYRRKKYIDSDKCFSVFYLPTLRGKKERNPFLDCDLEDTNKKFKDAGITFLLKPHPASIGDWNFTNLLSNFQIIGAERDVYDILPDVDLLITDYSSVHFDFILTGKACMFFPYDYDEYMSKDRGFNLDYDLYTPGYKAKTTDDLVSNIIETKNNYSEYLIKYEKEYNFVNEQVNKYRDAPDFSEIIKLIKG